jgi:hypothetical protein
MNIHLIISALFLYEEQNEKIPNESVQLVELSS